jgi:hypothetical protein
MRRPIAIAVTLLALAAPPAAAAMLGNPQVGFRADRTLSIDGHTYFGKIWAMPGEERHEQRIAAFRPILLLFDGNPQAEIVVPQLKTVVRFVVPPEWRLLDGRAITRRPIGRGIVNGIATTEYAVDETVPDGRAEGVAWLSPDGIPMKVAGSFIDKWGRPTQVRWELSHVRIGPQPAALFAPPPGYTRLPVEAIAPLFGLRLRSANRDAPGGLR